MPPHHTVARAEALELELGALFQEVSSALAQALRSDTLEWKLSYRGGRCTEVLLTSPRTQERFSSLRVLPLDDRALVRRLENLALGLESFLAALSQECDHAEDKAHGILCTFSGRDGALDEVLLEVFSLEHYASEKIARTNEVARTRSFRDAVAIPMHLSWYDAIAPLDDKAQRARAWTQERPQEAWAWLLHFRFTDMQGRLGDYCGAEILSGLVRLKSDALKQGRTWESVTERAIDQAIGRLTLFHDARTGDIDAQRERRYWEDPPPKLAHALTWRIVSHVVARHVTSRDLRVFELHPGGGQGDTLSLRDMRGRGAYGEELNDFRAYRRLGRDMPKGKPDPLGDGGYYVRRALFTDDFEGLIDDICARCGMEPGRTPASLTEHPRALSYALMAALLRDHVEAPHHLEWRSAVHDSSGYEGTGPRRAFDRERGGLEGILKTLPKPRKGTLHPLYDLWMLVHRDARNPPPDQVMLVIRPEVARAWVASKDNALRGLDLRKALKKEESVEALARLLWSRRVRAERAGEK